MGGALAFLDGLQPYGLESFVTGSVGADSVGGIVGELIGTMGGKEALSAALCDSVSPCACRSRQ